MRALDATRAEIEAEPWRRTLAARVLGLAALLVFFLPPWFWPKGAAKDAAYQTGWGCFTDHVKTVSRDIGTSTAGAFTAPAKADRDHALDVGFQRIGFIVFGSVPLAGIGLLLAPRGRLPRLALLLATLGVGGMGMLLTGWVLVHRMPTPGFLEPFGGEAFHMKRFPPLFLAFVAMTGILLRHRWSLWLARALGVLLMLLAVMSSDSPGYMGWAMHVVPFLLALGLFFEARRWLLELPEQPDGTPPP